MRTHVRLLRCRGNIKEASNKSLFILRTANPKSLSLPRGAASLALPEMEARKNDGENASFPQMHGGEKVGKTNLGNFGIGASSSFSPRRLYSKLGLPPPTICHAFSHGVGGEEGKGAREHQNIGSSRSAPLRLRLSHPACGVV